MKLVVSNKSNCMVKPQTPASERYLPLSEWDQIGSIANVPVIYFYKPSRDLVGLVESLKDSLSRALVPFYPLAGRLQWAEGNRLVLECNSMGAEFIEAEAEADGRLDQLGDFSDSAEYEDLAPEVDYTRPLCEIPVLAVQVTCFKCGGFTISSAISHVLLDGPGGLHFLTEWARMTRGEPLEIAPYFDRDVFGPLKDNELRSLCSSNGKPLETDLPPLLLGRTDSVEERKNETTVCSHAIFLDRTHGSREQMWSPESNFKEKKKRN